MAPCAPQKGGGPLRLHVRRPAHAAVDRAYSKYQTDVETTDSERDRAAHRAQCASARAGARVLASLRDRVRRVEVQAALGAGAGSEATVQCGGGTRDDCVESEVAAEPLFCS